MHNRKLSVLMPTRERPKMLRNAIHSIYSKAKYPNDVETAARLLNKLTSRPDREIKIDFMAIEAASECPTGG